MKTALHKRNSAIVLTICSIWVVCFLTGVPVWGYTENPVVLTDEQHHYPLGLHLAFLEDPTRTLTIDDVTAPHYAERFTPGSEDILNLGIGSVVYWIRIPIKNDTQHITDWRLRIENSYFDFIELYIPNIDTQGPPFTVKRSGDSIPFHEWDMVYRQFVFKIFLQPHTEQTVYVRIENLDGIVTPISLWSAEAFTEQISHEQLWYGVYFGSLGIMAGYNFFIFLSLRDKSYLSYVLFVLSWGLNEFSAAGFAYQYLWPNSPQWNEPLSVLVGTLSGFFALRFTAHFLKLAALHPVLNRVVTLLSAGWLVVCGATFITDLGTTNVFIQLLTLGSLAIIVIAPIMSWRHGYRPARYLLLAWSAFAMTGTISILTSFGILPAKAILLYSYPIGVVLLMLLLSWALADRINEMRTQAEQKRLQTVELQQAKNLALEAQRRAEVARSASEAAQRASEAAQRASEAAQRVSEAANHAKSMFLANMSHELRSPLNAILGFARVMAQSTTLPPEHQENVDIIRRSGEHLLTLINQVLDLSKIEAGRTTLDPQNFDLFRLLHDVQDMFALRAETKGLQLLFDRDESVPQYIHSDEVKLRQVLINVLNNAMKFTTEGGITLRVEKLETGNWKLENQQPTADNENSRQSVSSIQHPVSSIQFHVSDTGPGIAPEEIDKVFEAFGQTETGRQAQEGTGLGLPISRKFVQLMGGDMQVKSEIGQGTVVTFDIQAQKVDAADFPLKNLTRRVMALEPGQRAADGAPIEDGRYRILVVDDNRDNRQLFFTLLSNFISSPLSGFDLREAENGQEAIDVWETWDPHLIWMDMRMPVMDGYEATKRIRKLETRLPAQSRRPRLETSNSQFPVSNFQFQTKIIAVTASSFEEEQAVVLNAGCDDFLRKPFTDEEVFEMLRKHLGVRFVYEEEGVKVKGQRSKVEEVLTPEALAALPAEWLERLRQGARRADFLLLSRIIEQIREQNVGLADALVQLAEDFEYEKILVLLQQPEKEVME